MKKKTKAGSVSGNYKVWDNSQCNEDSANEYDATSVGNAAMAYAMDGWTPDDGDSMELYVRRPDGKLQIATVDVDFEPSFFVHVDSKIIEETKVKNEEP